MVIAQRVFFDQFRMRTNLVGPACHIKWLLYPPGDLTLYFGRYHIWSSFVVFLVDLICHPYPYVSYLLLPSVTTREARAYRRHRIRRCLPLTVKWCRCSTTSLGQRRSTLGDRKSRWPETSRIRPWQAGPAKKEAQWAATPGRRRQGAHLAVVSHRRRRHRSSSASPGKRNRDDAFPCNNWSWGPFFDSARTWFVVVAHTTCVLVCWKHSLKNRTGSPVEPEKTGTRDLGGLLSAQDRPC
jgi:hypothetical protein